MYNSDGYVLIDLTGVDITKTNQHLTGIYNRVLTVIDINKLALVINAGDLTPMAAVVHKKLNYYVINTPLYIFTINSNDIIMIEEAGEATVDVAIVPALLDGVKIADFTIGAVEGSLYAPEQQSEINDNITTDYTTWSSDKINTELSDKAEASDVYTKAQVDTALALKADTSDIPTKTSELLNDSGYITSAQVPTIDDSSVSSTSVWSSFKISGELATKANSSDVYTKAQVDTALSDKANSSDVYTKSEVDAALLASEYQIGDIINISNIQCIGILTTGQKSIYIQIPLPKSISNSVTTITVNSNSLWYIRHSAGGYILNNQNLTSIGSLTVSKNAIGIFIGLDLTNAFTAAPNNSPVAISLGSDTNNTITFS